MADPRVPRYELHIRPLFRWIDRHNMNALDPAKRIDLWDYDSVRAKADKIITRLAHGMPPMTHGGPWPQEWIDLFVRWKAAGFPRLERATAGSFELEQIGGGFLSVRISGTVPQAGYQVWLDSDQRVDLASEFTLYQEGPPPSGGPADTFEIEEFLRDPSPGIQSLTIHDAAGDHVIAIPAAVPAPPPIA